MIPVNLMRKYLKKLQFKLQFVTIQKAEFKNFKHYVFAVAQFWSLVIYLDFLAKILIFWETFL